VHRPSAPPRPSSPSSPGFVAAPAHPSPHPAHPPAHPAPRPSSPALSTTHAGARSQSARPPPRISTSAALRLSSLDFDLANAARRVVEGALGVVPGERLVLVVDRARRDVSAALLDVARTIGAEPAVFEMESLGERPIRQIPDALRAALARAQASVLLVDFEDGEIGLRLEILELVRGHGLRHAHMVGVTRKSMIAGFSVDHARILDATRAVRTRLRPDSVLRLRSATGSDLEARLDPTTRWSEHVGVIRPGRWENLPSGKLVTCPFVVRGVFVADASIGGHFGAHAGLLDRTPVRIEIEASYCRGVRSSDRGLQREVEAFLAREHNLTRVGAITLGTNVGILAPTGELVSDQNIPGLHITFGSSVPEQTGASWSTRIQLPMTSAMGDVDLDGLPLMRSGRYMVT
jgi:leucyl aminopeptidase (aminopeptidase T)